MSYQMITTNDALAAFCQAAAAHTALALDTEFVRTRSYYPKPGLLQLCFANEVALVDPLAISDWSAFVSLLRQQTVTKFLHAGGEDLEVLQHSFHVLPSPFIDTQVLAAFTGHRLSTGLASLVEQYAGVTLDKSESRTDWLARPLTERQCRYASADVSYLLPIAHTLMAQAHASGWLDAVRDECQLIQTRRCTPPQPEDAWRDISQHWLLRPRQLACLQLLAAWRLTQAQQQDLALNFVLRSEKLWQLARYLPDCASALAGLELSGREIRVYGEVLLALIAKAQALPDDALPAASVNPGQLPGFRQAMQEIKTLVEHTAERCTIASELLASRRQVMQLLNWHWRLDNATSTPELISGWRGELLAQPLRQVLARYPAGGPAAALSQ